MLEGFKRQIVWTSNPSLNETKTKFGNELLEQILKLDLIFGLDVQGIDLMLKICFSAWEPSLYIVLQALRTKRCKNKTKKVWSSSKHPRISKSNEQKVCARQSPSTKLGDRLVHSNCFCNWCLKPGAIIILFYFRFDFFCFQFDFSNGWFPYIYFRSHLIIYL